MKAENQTEMSQAEKDVLLERRRQVEKGYGQCHDNGHVNDEIAAMAALYIMPEAARDWDAKSTGYGHTLGEAMLPVYWEMPTFKDRRDQLVKGAAMALAEIERIDRETAGFSTECSRCCGAGECEYQTQHLGPDDYAVTATCADCNGTGDVTGLDGEWRGRCNCKEGQATLDTNWGMRSGPMHACPTCGNKRCPHAADLQNPCTNSNEPGQPGSNYPKVQT